MAAELYQRWDSVARARWNDFALADRSRGRRWTFGELFEEAEQLPPAAAALCGCGMKADLVLETIRGWRDDAAVCPVEQIKPDLTWLESLPPEIAHVKLGPGSCATERASLFTEAQIAADADAIVEAMGLRPDWPNLGAISMAHSYGYANLVLPLLLHGIPLVWTGDHLPGAVARALAEGEAFTVPATPALWGAWSGAGILDERKIKLAVTAGAPLPKKFSLSLQLHDFYGARECGGIAYDGQLLPGVDVEIVEGLIVVSGTSVANGKDQFCTGDEGELVGNRLLVRRLRRDLINVAGRKVVCDVVERTVALLDGVESVEVFGVTSADPFRVEEVAARVRLGNGTTVDQIRRQLRGSLLRHEIPQRWIT